MSGDPQQADIASVKEEINRHRDELKGLEDNVSKLSENIAVLMDVRESDKEFKAEVREYMKSTSEPMLYIRDLKKTTQKVKIGIYSMIAGAIMLSIGLIGKK